MLKIHHGCYNDDVVNRVTIECFQYNEYYRLLSFFLFLYSRFLSVCVLLSWYKWQLKLRFRIYRKRISWMFFKEDKKLKSWWSRKISNPFVVYPFDASIKNRNHFVRRNTDENVLFVILHYTNKYFNLRLPSNNTRARVSSHYVIAKLHEAPTDKQLLRVKYEFTYIINSFIVTIFV